VLKHFLFIIGIVFIFQSFYFFRELQTFYVVSKVGLPVLGLLVLIALRPKIGGELWVIFLLYCILCIISSFRAEHEYGQDLVLGILAQVKLINVFIYPLAFCFFEFFSKKQNYLEYSIFLTSCYILFFYLSVYMLIGPEIMEAYSEYQTYSSSKGTRWSFPASIIVFSFFFCWVLLINNKTTFKASGFFKFIVIVYMTLFIYYFLVYFQQKMQLFSMVFSCTLYLFLNFKRKHKLYGLCFFSIFLVFLVGYKYELIIRLLNFEVDSLFIRARTISTIFSHFVDDGFFSFMFGFGNLLSVADVNFQDIYGLNFWPADVGWIGIFFEFGLFGFLITTIVWVIILYYIFHSLFKSNDALSHAASLYILAYFILSPLVPKIVFGIGELMVCLAIIMVRKNISFINKS
jgi:hypothetical protein